MKQREDELPALQRKTLRLNELTARWSLWTTELLQSAVLNFQAAAHERHDAGVASDCNLEQPSDEMELAHNLTDAYPPDLPLPNRMHGFVTLDRQNKRKPWLAGTHRLMAR